MIEENNPSKIVEDEIIGEEEPKHDKRDKSFLEIDERLLFIKDNREEIRVKVGSLLRINGLLLTASLGVLYFTLKDSKDAGINVPMGFANSIFLISALLLVSTSLCLASIYFKPYQSANREEIEASLNKIYSREVCLMKISIFIILLSIIFFIYSLFLLDQNYNSIVILNPVLDIAIIISIIYKYIHLFTLLIIL